MVAELQELQSQGYYEDLAHKLDEAQTRLQLLLRARSLLVWAQAKNRNEESSALQSTIEDLANATVLGPLGIQLDQIEASLLKPAPAGAGVEAANLALPPGGVVPASTQPLSQRVSRSKVRLLEIARPTITILGGLLLAFVGFETLYVNGSATFGANAITDYLSVFVWGVSADVASRTIGTLGQALSGKTP